MSAKAATKRQKKAAPVVEVPATIELTLQLDAKLVKNLLICGFDGPMTASWCRIVAYDRPESAEAFDCYTLPLLEGCAVILEDHYDRKPKGPYRLDRAALIRGFKLLHEKYPHHLGAFFGLNEDAITGDAFIQCCVLGGIVYG